MSDKTPDILIPALRQYQHNDCSGLLAGFDYDETVKIVTNLQQQVKPICQPQWIPVTERLPIAGETVDVWVDFRGGYRKTDVWFDGYDFLMASGSKIVSHWRVSTPPEDTA